MCGINCTYNKLKIHLQKKQNVTVVTEHSVRTKCTYPGCSNLFYQTSKMIAHLNIYHQINMQVEVLNFLNEKNFMKWKGKEELKNFVYYFKAT